MVGRENGDIDSKYATKLAQCLVQFPSLKTALDKRMPEHGIIEWSRLMEKLSTRRPHRSKIVGQ